MTLYFPIIYVYGGKLKVIDSFVYLGCTMSSTNTLDNEISKKICKTKMVHLEDLMRGSGDVEEYPLGLS